MNGSRSQRLGIDPRRRRPQSLALEGLESRRALAVTVGLSGTVLNVAFDDAADDAITVAITSTGYTTTGATESSGSGTVTRLQVSDAGGAQSSRFTLEKAAQTLNGGLTIDGNVDVAVIGGSIRTEGGPVTIGAKSTTVAAAAIDAGVGQQTFGGSVLLRGGTRLGTSLRNLTVVGDTMFFAVGDGPQAGLWKTDGTSAGTVLVKGGIGSARNMVDVGGVLVFTASSPATGEELWRSDGTESGTYMLRDFVPGSGSGFPLTYRSPGYEVADGDQTFAKVVFGNQMFFGLSGNYGNEPPYDDNGLFWRLWKTDGTVAGTVPVVTVPTGNTYGSPGTLAIVGDRMVFSAYTPLQGGELWVSNGTASGTRILRDIRPGSASSNPGNFVPLDATTLLFIANDGTGQEVWKTDGTTEGTVRVKDINATAGSDPAGMTAGPGGLFFTATDGVTGRELWKTDGSESGTVRVADINQGSGSSNPVGLRSVGSGLYFTATNGADGYELWRTDGTAAGTSMTKDIRAGSQPTSALDGPFPLASVGDTFYFTADDGTTGFELWKSDGSAAGTSLVQDVRVGAGDAFTDVDPIVVATVGGRLFFRVLRNESLAFGDSFELWATDGTPTGTSRVLADRVNGLTSFKGEWYLFAGTDNARLCRLDATTDEVVVVAEMASVALTGSTVVLGGGVSGTGQSLSIAAAAELRGPVSGLFSLDVSGNALVGGGISTTRSQTFAQNLRLTADASLVAGHLHFGGTVDGDGRQLTLRSVSRSGTPPSSFTNVSVLSVSPPDVRAPQPPSAVEATFGDRQVSLVWTAPTDDGGSPITDFVVEMSTNDGSTWTIFQDGVSSATSATVSGLVNGTSYVFRISAVNVIGSGTPSPPSAATRPATIPGPPQYFTAGTVAGPGPGIIRLAWVWPLDGGGSDTTDFIVECSADDGANWTTVDDGVSTATQAVVPGLLKGVTYAFRVSAVNGVGRGSPTSVIRMAPMATPPDKPTAVVALPAAGAATLSWSPPLYDGIEIEDYVIEYSPDGGAGWNTFSDGTGASTSATVTGLASDTAYVFRVSAVNSAGQGTPSANSAAVTPFAPVTVPAAPTNVSGTPGDMQVSLTWTAPSNHGGAVITDYVVQYRSTAAVTWNTFSDGTGASTSATVTGLTNGTAYVFRVSAVNSAGQGTPSAESGPVAPARTAPAAPTNVAGTPGDRRVSLTWTAPVTNGGAPITDYIVQFRTAAGTTWSTFADGVRTGTSATVTGLTNGTAYLFRVSAVNSVGTGIASVESAPVAPRTVPAAPTNVIGTPGHSQVSLTWSAPAKDGGAAVTDYVVQFKTASAAAWTTFNDGSSTNTSTTVTGLTNGTRYVFRVIAVNQAGQGGASVKPATVTPRTVPSEPRSVKGVAGNGRVSLSWAAPSSNGGAAVTDYLIEYSNNGAGWVRFSDGVSSRNSATVTGLSNGARYVFRVAAVNAAGTGAWSSPSAVVSPRR